MKNYITAILLAILAIPSFGQSISIFDIDTTNFPTMKAKFYAFDKDGKQYKPNASELTITENGINRTIMSVICPPPSPPQALSSVLVIDVSGSMGSSYSSVPNIELAKTAATAWVNALPLGQSECAITSFDHSNYLNQDFSQNKTKLLKAISQLAPNGGTDYNAALINQMSGGLLVSNNAKYKKVIILLTDGLAQDPPINLIISEAKKQNCTIFCVTLGMFAPQSLKDIASGTGGQTFESVSTINEAEEVYRKIFNIAQSGNTCEITWNSDFICDPNKTNVEIKWQEIKSYIGYKPKINSIANLKVSPNYIAMGKRIPNSQNDTTIILTAENSDFTINSINRKFGSADFTIVNSSFPFIISKNTNKVITLRFEPSDSSLKYASFEFETDKCFEYFSSSGGYPEKKSNSSTSSLKLTHPNGGEKFVIGSDTTISWTGVSPTDKVSLEFSIDSGKTWKLITQNANGMIYHWKNIPFPSTNKCLINTKMYGENIEKLIYTYKSTPMCYDVKYSSDGRMVAILIADGEVKIFNAITGEHINSFYTNNFGGDYSIVFSPDNRSIATGSFKYADIWEVKTGRLINSLSGHSNIIWGIDFSKSENKIVTACADSTAKVWDINTRKELITFTEHRNRVSGVAISPNGKFVATSSHDSTAKIWDINTGKTINTLLGHTNSVADIKFSPDGGRVATASLDSTAKIWDVNSGTPLVTLLGHSNSIWSISFNGDGSKVATVSRDGTAKIWDAISGSEIRSIQSDSTRFHKIAFSPIENKVATAGWQGTLKIWDLDISPLHQDVSDSVFSIVAPSPQSQNVDMKQCIVGVSRDSLVSSFMINNGTYQFRVDSIAITGANTSQFRLVSGTPPFVVPANANRAVEFNFKPTSVGIKTAQLTIYTQADTLLQTIQGEGIAPQLEIVNNLIDFGLVDVWSFKDTIQVVTIKNVGSAALNINNSLHLGPNDIDFTTLSGAAPFSLNAGEIAKMNLRFAPKAKGRTSGRLQFEFNGAGSPATVQLFGTGIGNNAIIKVGKDSAFTEEQVEIPVEMEIPNLLIQDGVTAISFELEMNKTILFPIGVNSTIDGDNRIIKFDSVPIKNVGVNEVTKLKFIATLGTAEETAIRVRNIIPIGNDADFDVIDGNFKLLGVCKDGGDRFLSSSLSQTKLLSIAPNPTTESIEIEYSNADEGEAEIIISNLLGQTILTQKLEKTQTGKTKLDLSQLPTGQYSILFKTETLLENRVIQVIK